MTPEPEGTPGLFVAVPPGIEPLLDEEVRELLGPIPGAERVHGGVELPSNPGRMERILLHSAIASRVLLRVGSFRARGFAELERRVAAIDLSPFRRPDEPVHLEIASRKSRLYHTGAIEERIRRVLELPAPDAPPVDDDDGDDRVDDPTGTPGSTEEPDSRGAPLRVVVRVERDVFTLSVDGAGTPMHRRGYRLRTAKAPLRETLAAALLRAAGWSGEAPLHDPFCGSGTIPIEAARRARRIAPGLERSFSAEGWPSADLELWRRLRDEAAAAVRPSAGVAIGGSDRDAGAIDAAHENAVRAGVGGDAHFGHGAVSSVEAPPGTVWVTNPPWGLRTRAGDLRNLFAALAERRRAAGEGRMVLLTDDPRPLRAGGLPSRTVLRTRAGGIDVSVERVEES